MLNVTHALERMNIPSSRAAAVQTVRMRIESAPDPLIAASKFINDIIGVPSSFSDNTYARVMAQAVVDEAMKAGGEIDDAPTFYAAAEARVDKYLNDPKNAWMFAKPDLEKNESLSGIDGSRVEVVIKANGKIKKGGKQVLAASLFKKHVLESSTPCTNQEFIKILMIELNMSKMGASTYAHDTKKAFNTEYAVKSKKP